MSNQFKFIRNDRKQIYWTIFHFKCHIIRYYQCGNNHGIIQLNYWSIRFVFNVIEFNNRFAGLQTIASLQWRYNIRCSDVNNQYPGIISGKYESIVSVVCQRELPLCTKQINNHSDHIQCDFSFTITPQYVMKSSNNKWPQNLNGSLTFWKLKAKLIRM